VPRKPKNAGKPGGFVQTTVEIEGRTEMRIVEMPAFEPAAWGDDAELGIVGARVPRMDAPERVSGRARYTADITRPGMLHAVILRSIITRPTARGSLAARFSTRGSPLPPFARKLCAPRTMRHTRSRWSMTRSPLP